MTNRKVKLIDCFILKGEIIGQLNLTIQKENDWISLYFFHTGEQIALNVDGCDAHNTSDKSRSKSKYGKIDNSASDSDLNFPDGRMDRQVLTSSRAVRDTSRYAVGILDQNELHITPIEGVLSLRPSMEYLDQSDKTAKGQ